MKFLKQLFCKHDYKFVVKQKNTQQNLWECEKCGMWYVQHYGLGIGYKVNNQKEIMITKELFDIKE